MVCQLTGLRDGPGAGEVWVFPAAFPRRLFGGIWIDKVLCRRGCEGRVGCEYGVARLAQVFGRAEEEAPPSRDEDWFCVLAAGHT